MVLACAKEKYNALRIDLFESTIKPIANLIDVYYLFGQSDNTPLIPVHPNVRKLVVPCADNWEDIPMKIYNGFTQLGNFGYDYIIKIDENITVRDPILMISQIESEIAENPYIALKEATTPGDGSVITFSYYHRGKCSNRAMDSMPAIMSNIAYAGGPGYVLSRVAYLSLKKEIYSNCLFEDFATGFNLQLVGVTPYVGETSKQGLIKDPDNVDFIRPLPSIKFDYKKYMFALMKATPSSHRMLFMAIHGGLGNQLFQLATGIAYAAQHNRKLWLYSSPTNGRKYYWDSLLSQFDLVVKDKKTISANIMFKEPSFHYSPIPDNPCERLVIDGYFQSSKYFHEYRYILKQIPKFPSTIRKALMDKYGGDLWTPNHVIVHARRGDYVAASDYHALQPDEYYVAAKALIETKVSEPTYILISDDPEYWKRSPVFAGSKVLHFNEDDIETFYLIMNSHNIVMANSTFSWWGAYLSEASTVIAPKTWFGPKGPADWSSIYVDGWTVL